MMAAFTKCSDAHRSNARAVKRESSSMWIGRLEFGSYDNFHPECIVCLLGVGTDLLDALRDKGVIRSWAISHEGAPHWHG